MQIRQTIPDDFGKIDLQDIQRDEFNTEITPLTYTFLRDSKPVAILKIKIEGAKVYIASFIGRDIKASGLLSLVRKGKELIRAAENTGRANCFNFVVKDGFKQGQRLAGIMGFTWNKMLKINNTYYREYEKWQA